jgi:putative tricarboxylic transport membrane protein
MPPMILGLVLSPLFETSLRQSLTLSLGDPMIFVSRPLSAALLACAALALIVPMLMILRGKLRGAS